jgi:hypothetical protein
MGGNEALQGVLCCDDWTSAPIPWLSMPHGELEADGALSRRRFIRAAGVMVLAVPGFSVLSACASDEPQASVGPEPGGRRTVTLYRQEGCSCCVTYADYLRDSGFSVDLKTVEDLGPIHERYAIPVDGVGCHTSVVDGYVVEGHVPVEAINRLLGERPALDGISVVGMPANSPGMGKPNGQPLAVLAFGGGHVSDYMTVTTF